MWWTPTNLPEALQYMEALSNGLTDKECIQALAEEMMKLNDWLGKMGIQAARLGMFQPEHPELPGSGCVRTWSNNGAGEGKLWIPIREQVEKHGIEILYETPARDLVLSPSTREIIGVQAAGKEKTMFIKARKESSSRAAVLSSISRCKSNSSRDGPPTDGELPAIPGMGSGWRKRQARRSGT
jgi:hypothetical protein